MRGASETGRAASPGLPRLPCSPTLPPSVSAVGTPRVARYTASRRRMRRARMARQGGWAMSRIHGWCLGAWLVAGLSAGAEPAAPTGEDVWEVAHSGDARIGFVHTTVLRADGGRRLRTTAEMDLSFRR